MAELAFAPAAETHGFFQLLLFLRTAHLAQFFSHSQISIWISKLAAFADPAEELSGVKETIAAINQCRRRAIFEFEKAGVASFMTACFVPNPRDRTHAANFAAADQARDIDLMRALVQNHAMAHRQLMFHARAIHEFIVVPAVNHAEFAQIAAPDDLAYLTNRWIE